MPVPFFCAIVEKTGTTVGSGSVTSTKQFVWVGTNPAEERNASSTVTERFFAQGEQISGTNYYYTRDHLGSVREMVDNSGNIQSRYDYDPYGRVTPIGAITVASDFEYAGYYEHATSGLNLTRGGDGISTGRPYDPNTAKWLSRDPLGEQVSSNLYQYCYNDPIDWIDPWGLAPYTEGPGPVHIDTDGPGGSTATDSNYRPDLPGGATGQGNWVASTPGARAAGVKIGDPADFTSGGKTVHCTVQDSRMTSGVEVNAAAASAAGIPLAPTSAGPAPTGNPQGTIVYNPSSPAPTPPSPSPSGAYSSKRGR